MPDAGDAAGARVALAAVAGAHGIQGEVRLKLFADGPASLERHKVFDAGGLTLTLRSLRPDKTGAIARFAEIADRTAAEALRGTVLTVARTDLPPLAAGEYYHADLIGLPVVDTDGAGIGIVVAVENFGAGDILEIEKPDATRFMVPFTPVAVPKVGAAVVIAALFVS